MLPRAHRLTKKKDFDEVFKKGKSAKVDFLVVKALKNNRPESRFGFVVSKKISNKATIRNKVKRRLSQAVFFQLPGILISVDVVMIALLGIEKKEFFEIKELVDEIIKKI